MNKKYTVFSIKCIFITISCIIEITHALEQQNTLNILNIGNQILYSQQNVASMCQKITYVSFNTI